MPPQAAVLPAAPPQLSLRDFSDRISPMLVKELRQGLKSPFFVWGLMLMQVLLLIGAALTMVEMNRDSNSMFWWGAATAVCILLPLRAANALRDEMNGNTLDTLVLTHLSAWRITLGKWVATASLQVLLAVTVMPYLIVRYFAGGVNLPQEILCLGLFTLFGVSATAVMLGLSFFRYFLIRAAVMLAVLAGCIGFCAGMIDELDSGTESIADLFRSDIGWAGAAGLLMLLIWAVFFFLDLGASQIAPIAENRATRRRLVALGTFTAAVCCFLNMRPVDAAALSLITGLCAILAAVQAVCEKPAPYAPVLQPFVKRGLAGRLAGRLLYPGWASGVLFASLVITGAGAVALFAMLERHTAYVASYPPYRLLTFDWVQRFALPFSAATLGVLSLVIAPVVLYRAFSRKKQWSFGWWFAFLTMIAAFHAVLALINTQAESDALTYSHIPVPGAGILAVPLRERQAERDFLAEKARRLEAYRARNPRWKGYELPNQQGLWEFRDERRHHHTTVLGLAGSASALLWLLAALLLAAREFRRLRTAERELALALASPPEK